ncbi:transglycosylase, Slt family protein [Pseudooceanicola batsensis HTCC2597]|uniref:Transglycosylase, Slt family protein n=1 Tax=Pseudooceanicola batsensis (strain ATCC BAA-863 / DSM 15984 / KCTC 12145 / HTCC2597) TaxID=252305 RepID=A3U130_PSEBH|nr:transglycosylase SLT domain-containing protein [Pseudooceanicola batsensis]EAQ02013.1 transglycosylase, Slt family protein [Pseudooceanicola batsensis HTCC2597]
MRAALAAILLLWPGQSMAQWTGFYTPSEPAQEARPPAGPTGASGLCVREILLAQMRYRIPDNLLLGIGLQESGLYRGGDLTVWPYAANAEGRGKYFDSEAEAVAWVNAQKAAGVSSIDVGCMQINMHWHPDAFDTVADGFNPARNVDYAAAYLTRLYRAKGDWKEAAASYHSRTDELGQAYLARLEHNVQVANARFDKFRDMAGATDRAPQGAEVRRMPTSGVFWTADLGGGTGGAGGRSLFGPGEIAPILPDLSRGS